MSHTKKPLLISCVLHASPGHRKSSEVTSSLNCLLKEVAQPHRFLPWVLRLSLLNLPSRSLRSSLTIRKWGWETLSGLWRTPDSPRPLENPRLSQASGEPPIAPFTCPCFSSPLQVCFRQCILGRIPKGSELLRAMHTSGSVCYTIHSLSTTLSWGLGRVETGDDRQKGLSVRVPVEKVATCGTQQRAGTTEGSRNQAGAAWKPGIGDMCVSHTGQQPSGL